MDQVRESGYSVCPEPMIKRPMDLLLASVGLALLSPLWIVCSLAVHLEDGGPVLFVQERCGRNGRVFKALKFRTMRLPNDGKAHVDVDLDNDPRVTRVGRILRGTALDELPELINILRGDMSFVGPRPLPYRIEDDESVLYGTLSEVPGYYMRSRVRPGLTGLAQIYAPKNARRRTKFRFDSLYVAKMSLGLDARLLLISLFITLRRRWEKGGVRLVSGRQSCARRVR